MVASTNKNNCVEEIHRLFFEERLMVTEVARRLSISNGKVTYTIQKHPRYEEEKERRKIETAENRKVRRAKKARENRAIQAREREDDNTMAILERLQAMNAISMSQVGNINNSFVSTMAPYKYDGKAHMVFDESVYGVKPNDIPARICIKIHNSK